MSRLIKLQNACDELKRVFQREDSSNYTERLAQKNHERNRAFLSLTGYLRGLSRFNIKPEKAAAASNLIRIIEKHGSTLYRLGYTKESAALYSLLKELALAESQEWIREAGAEELCGQLDSVAKSFEELHRIKITKESAIDLPLQNKAMRDVIYRLNFLLTYIDTDAYEDPDTYGTCAMQISEVIDEIMSRVRARRTRHVNEMEEAALPPGEEGGIVVPATIDQAAPVE